MNDSQDLCVSDKMQRIYLETNMNAQLSATHRVPSVLAVVESLNRFALHYDIITYPTVQFQLHRSLCSAASANAHPRVRHTSNSNPQHLSASDRM